jgi:hypothetical protein
MISRKILTTNTWIIGVILPIFGQTLSQQHSPAQLDAQSLPEHNAVKIEAKAP